MIIIILITIITPQIPKKLLQPCSIRRSETPKPQNASRRVLARAEPRGERWGPGKVADQTFGAPWTAVLCNIGALITRIGFRVYYTIIIRIGFEVYELL